MKKKKKKGFIDTKGNKISIDDYYKNQKLMDFGKKEADKNQ
mgnify:CR=1 FL=1